jgi:signal transduction histidine kinase
MRRPRAVVSSDLLAHQHSRRFVSSGLLGQDRIRGRRAGRQDSSPAHLAWPTTSAAGKASH